MIDIEELAEAVAKERPIDLEHVSLLAKRLKDATMAKIDLEERLESLLKEIHQLSTVTLVDAMDKLGIDHIGIPGEGNEPGFDIDVRPDIKAAIAASWDSEKRAEAFNELDRVGAADLIKSSLTVRLPRTKEATKQLSDLIDLVKGKVSTAEIEVKQDVHWASLTSWLKSEVKAGRFEVDTDKIGAFIGRKTFIKERNDD